MTTPGGDRPLLEARRLGKSYHRERGWFLDAERQPAFTDVDLDVTPGRVLGLVGGSGAGKSSLARCLALLERPDSGRLRYCGADAYRGSGRELRELRGRLQLVFQDAARSFNPRWTAREVLEEPLVVAGKLPARERTNRLEQLASQVGLEGAQLDRPARSFSGGQMKRLSLARALAREPRALILDEPFSGLDVSLKAQMANLLMSLQQQLGFACVFISHDLTMVSRLADEIAVMDRGRIVELGAASEVVARPVHPTTRALLSASRPATRGAAG